MSDGELSPQAETVVRVSAALATGEPALGRELAEAARRVDAGLATRRAVEEALLQAYLFLGFPATLEGLAAWRELGLPAVEDVGRESEPESWAERGRRLCRRVYGAAYDTLRANVRSLHPELDRWMVEEGYGKVLARPGLDAVERELCVVATLALEGRPRQLRSHLLGALNVGAGEERVEVALAASEDVAGVRLGAVRELWDEVRGAARARSDIP